MNNRLHKYLDDSLKDIIDYDFPYYLDELYEDYFDDIEIQISDDDYYKNDLIKLNILGIMRPEILFGITPSIEPTILSSLIMRRSDIENEFSNIQNIIDYIKNKLIEHNNSLKKK